MFFTVMQQHIIGSFLLEEKQSAPPGSVLPSLPSTRVNILHLFLSLSIYPIDRDTVIIDQGSRECSGSHRSTTAHGYAYTTYTNTTM